MRAAFTLIELLLALCLAAILMSAVSGSLLSHYRAVEKGHGGMNVARAELSFASRFRLDLSEVKFQFGSPSLSFPGIVSSEIGSEKFLDFGTDFQLDPLELWGQRDLLVIGRLAPSEITNGKTTRNTKPSQQVIVWAANVDGDVRVPFRKSGNQVGFTALKGSEIFTALRHGEWVNNVVRIELELTGTLRVRELTRYPKEIEAIRFRYFDGTAWREQWDSAESGSLPVLVEVNVSSGASFEYTRFIVAVTSEKVAS